MLMTRYEPLIFNANFTETSSDGKYVAYRGELTICEGEVADAQGRRMAPKGVLKQSVSLASGDKLVFVGGFTDKLELLEPFVAKYGPDFTPATSQAQAEARQDQPRRSHGPGGSMSSRPPLQGLETPS